MKWQYFILPVQKDWTRLDMQSQFNALGTHGWELVTVLDSEKLVANAVFKRPGEQGA